MISDPAGKYLYTAWTTVTVWLIDAATGALTQVGETGLFGFNDTYFAKALAIDPLGRFLFAATDWGIYGWAINGTTGLLTPLAGSPFYGANGTDGVSFDGSGRFLYVVQEGSGDLWGFAVDGISGNLTLVPGSPFLCSCSSVAADVTGKYAYAGTFTGYGIYDSAVLAYQIDTVTGALTYINGVTPGGSSIALVPAAGSPTAAIRR